MSRLTTPVDRIHLYNSGDTLFSDTFTDADGTLLPAHTPDLAVNGAAWVKDSTDDLKIVSNKCDAADITPVSQVSYHYADMQLQDLTISCDVTISDSDNSKAIIMCRYIDPDNWIGVVWNQWAGLARSCAIKSMKAGVEAVEDAFEAIPASVDNDTVTIDIVCTATTVYATMTDEAGNVYESSGTPFATTDFANATKAGLCVNQNLITFDNIVVTKT